ncbi:MAG: alpha/beta fold hydrolase [Anaerolineae bacterium]
MRKKPLLWLAVGTASTIAATAAVVAFRRDKRATITALRGSSRVHHTPHGAVEYATHGEGEPLQFVNGGMGGYEQGLSVQRMLGLTDHRLISPSRPGYRQTNTGGSLVEQAAAMHALLDHLGIEQTNVLALSAGGLAALQFATDYPDRCQRLILLSAHGPELVYSQPSRFWLVLLDAMLGSDFLVWVLMRFGMGPLMRLMGVRSANYHTSIANLKDFLRGVFPSTDWREGTLNDVRQLLAGHAPAVEQIRVPTLILHGTRDVIVPPVVALDTAQRIQGAQHVEVAGGTHMMMATHAAEIERLIRSFYHVRRLDPPG